jgi:hypothetical protein
MFDERHGMSRPSRGYGSWLVILASIMGLAVSYFDYVTPETGIDQSGGVLLVLAAMALMLGAGLVVALLGPGGARSLLRFLILLDIVGTATAGYFLESPLLMGTMMIAAIGWFMSLAARAPGKTP